MWHLCRLQTIISAPCMGGSSRELSDAVGTAIPFLWCASPRELQTCAHQCASLTLTLQVCPIPGENTGSHNESAVNPTVDSESSGSWFYICHTGCKMLEKSKNEQRLTRPWEQSPMLHPQPLLHGVPGVLGRHPGHVRGLGGLQVIRCTRRKRETITCSEDCTGFMTIIQTRLACFLLQSLGQEYTG
nr:uncharacterized protein LOC105759165 isoform X3 [Taeniopygia guttata]